MCCECHSFCIFAIFWNTQLLKPKFAGQSPKLTDVMRVFVERGQEIVGKRELYLYFLLCVYLTKCTRHALRTCFLVSVWLAHGTALSSSVLNLHAHAAAWCTCIELFCVEFARSCRCMVQACMAAVACCAVMLMQPTHTLSTTSLLQYPGGPGQWARSHEWVVNASLFSLQNEWKDNSMRKVLNPFYSCIFTCCCRR